MKEFSEFMKSFDPCNGAFDYDGRHVEYKITPHGYQICITRETPQDDDLLDYIEDFKDEVKNIDDDIFAKACELFPEATNMTLHDLSKILDDANHPGKVLAATNNFRDCVLRVVSDEINRLELKYFNK